VVGTRSNPFPTVAGALAASRTRRANISTDTTAACAAVPPTIVLKKGIHYLNETISLGAKDSGLTITSAPGSVDGDVVVSGGVVLTSPKWVKSDRHTKANATIWVTETKLKSIIGLTTLAPHRRVTRAREPNANPWQGAELCTDCWHNGVTRWHKDLTCVGMAGD
jgi:hypothetical protein